jgi:opacity protein-like surface antigen
MSSDVDFTKYSLGKNDCGTAAYQSSNQSFPSIDGKSVQHTTACSYKDQSTDFLLGLGVEAKLTDNWFGRIEANHFFANKGEAITAAKFSIGYKF